jgi:hypothetical protein
MTMRESWKQPARTIGTVVSMRNDFTRVWAADHAADVQRPSRPPPEPGSASVAGHGLRADSGLVSCRVGTS